MNESFRIAPGDATNLSGKFVRHKQEL